jgi:hypothetical protein
MIQKRDDLIGVTSFAEMFQIPVLDVRRMIRQELLPGYLTHDNKVLIDLAELLKEARLEKVTPSALVWHRNVKSMPRISKKVFTG